MPDNITAPATGAVLATDEIGGVHYPRTKLSVGADGTAVDVSTGNPLPVSLITGYATAAKQDDLIAAIEGISPGGGSGGDASAANQVAGNDLLAGILGALGATLTVDGTIELGATALAALETTELGAATLAALESINANVTGTVELGSTSLTALETTELGATTLAALETTELGATSLAALESITANVAGVATEAKQDANTLAVQKLGSGKRWFAIAPADTALATVPDAIYVGGAGNIVARGSDGVDATFAVVAGQTISISPAQVRAASTATGLIGLVS